MASRVNATFHTELPAELAVDSTVFRCDRGKVMVCTTGANLPCGKADISRTNTGAQAWCQAHPGLAAVPAFASGHTTIFEWGCRGRTASIVRQAAVVDPRGFISAYWRPLR